MRGLSASWRLGKRRDQLIRDRGYDSELIERVRKPPGEKTGMRMQSAQAVQTIT